MQTAHDPQYLVKHLLWDLPAVTERVKSMRSTRSGGAAEDNKNRMFASQEAYLKVAGRPPKPASHGFWLMRDKSQSKSC